MLLAFLYRLLKANLIIIVILSFNSGKSYSTSTNNPDNIIFYELTTTDITKNSEITAINIKVFGLYLSMKLEEVLPILKHNLNIYLKQDPYNSNRYYLYDREKYNGKDIVMAYLIWGNDNIGLKEIVLYHGFLKFMVGNSRMLLTYDAIDKHTYIYSSYLGFPSRMEVILDIPDIKMKSTAFYYPNKNFKIIKTVSEQVVSFSMSLVLKLEEA